jgi:hypothetical protein
MLVFLDVLEKVLLDRLAEKGIADATALKSFEGHSTEVDVKMLLRSKADLVLDGSRGVDELADTVVDRLSLK